MSNEVKEFVEEDEDTQKGKYMTFILGNECYGIGINYVNEIIGLQRLTEIPEVEDYIKGLMNLRGKIIPVIDVRVRFKKQPLPYNDRTCIIVIDVNATVIGLIVDSIAEVVTIEDGDVVPPPNLGSGTASNKYVYGIGKIGEEVKLLLNCDKLINDEDLKVLAEIEQQ